MGRTKKSTTRIFDLPPYRSLIQAHLLYAAALALFLMSGCPTGEPADLSPRPTPGERHLFRLAHITDPQIIDEESPARAVRFTAVSYSGWRPQEAYGVHTLDATLQAINRIHSEGERPVDFVMITGDLVDLAQQNELDWFMATMDGGVVRPDSGAADGVARHPAPALNPKLPYDAEGLDPEIPWYTCYGNHDGLAVGTFPIDRTPAHQEDWFAPLLPPVARILGLHALGPDNNSFIATDDWSPAVILGSGVPYRDERLQLDLGQLYGGRIVPDDGRRFLSKRDFIAAHLNSTSQPPGHGFTAASLDDGRTYYSARPLPEVPLRLIVFDTVAETDQYGLPFHYGTLSRRHFEDFVLPELEGAAAAGDWVILASHHPAADFDLGIDRSRVRAAEFRALAATYPNVIMHLFGHTHRHRAETVRGTNPYLEISTSAIIDYPQEGRLLDVFLDADGRSIRVESQIFGHSEAPTTFSAESLRRARIDAENRAKIDAAEGREKARPEGEATDRNFAIRLAR